MTKRPTRSGARLLALAAVVALVFAGAGAASGSGTQPAGERIMSYDVEIRVETSGAMVVTEVLDYDFGAEKRHGIFRDIPVRLRYDDRYDRVYPVEVVSVEGSPGTPDEYETETQGSSKRIKIGDPDRTITGRHRYTITYTVEGALNGFSEHDELYWNAIGADWPAPIAQAKISVTVPGKINEVACFAGPFRSTLPCAEASHSEGTARFSQAAMSPHEALTVVVGFPKGVVEAPAPILDERWSFARAFEVTPATLAGSTGLLMLVVGGVASLVWNTGRDRRWTGSPVDIAFGSLSGDEEHVPLLERAITPVEFVPPDGVLPGQVGTLVDEAANPLDVTATIVDLAVKGYLRIEEISKKGWFGKPDWNLIRTDKGPDALREYERRLIDGLFRDGPEVKLSELRDTFAARLQTVQDALYNDVVAHGWFGTRPDHVRTLWKVIGYGALAAGVGAVVVTAAYTRFGLLAVPLGVGGVLMLACAHRMPRRTAKGTAVLRRVQGFRRLIEESERDRARFAEEQNLFSEYLPYAVVFGCTEKWARAFAGLDDQLPETSWYVGSRPFTAGAFSDSIDGFTVSTAGTIASTPSGSGSSGFSGGSSGGGGGGGGGGSW